jgi:ParB/RepB/Spo0J family partition protein
MTNTQSAVQLEVQSEEVTPVEIPNEYFSEEGKTRKPSTLRSMNTRHAENYKKSQNEADKKTARNNSISIDKSLIRLVPGFNLRKTLTEEHIANFEHSYRAGMYVPPIVVRVVEIEGELVAEVLEGHNRFVAMMRVDELTLVEVNEFKGDDVEAVILMLTSSQGKPLNPIEKADGYGRLVSYGMSPSDIARKLNISPASVSQNLSLNKMPYRLKSMIKDNMISATLAREYFTEHGDKVLDFLENQGVLSSVQTIVEANEVAVTESGATNEAAVIAPEVKAPKKITKKRVNAAPKPPKLNKEDVQTMCGLMESLASQYSVDDLENANEVNLKLSREDAIKLQQVGAELQALRLEMAKLEAEKDQSEKDAEEARKAEEKQALMDI